MEDYAINILEELKKTLRNFKKTPNRNYKKETLEKKLQEIIELREEFEEITSDIKEKSEIIGISTEFQQYFKSIRKIIEEKLIMSNSDFKIDIAIKAIPNFNGNYKELESFLVIAKIINDGLNTAGKAEFLNFIFHVKLSNNVKTAIGNHTVPQDFASLETALKERYKNNVTLPQILNKLANIVQRNLSVISYKEILLNTINELTQIQIEQLGNNATTEQKKAISITNEMQALQIFKSGLNDQIRPTVTAARPSTLAEAINIALEVESNDKQKNIMHIQTNRKNQQNYNYNNRRYNNNTNFNKNYQSNNNNYRHNNNNNNRQFQQQNRYQQNNYRYQQNNNGYHPNNNSRQIQYSNNNRGQYNTNNQNYQNRNQQHTNYNRNQQNGNRPQRVHITQQENYQGPDQENPEGQ